MVSPVRLQPAPDLFDVARIRADFPILSREVHGKPLVFLDSAASAQKPQVVIDAVRHCYEAEYANIHRGVHYLSETATHNYEATREKVRAFINARETKEIIFVRGATEAINLVAASWGGANLKPGDEILITALEHHSNIVPWQMIAEKTGALVRAVPTDETGDFLFERFEDMLTPRTKIVAITHASNAIGTVVPIKDVVATAHARGIPVLIDGCQGIVHRGVDVQDVDCDFYVFSAHKLYGPSGIGVLYGKADLLEAMPPYQGGGDMIETVSIARSTYAALPHKFEAGTPNIAGTVGFGAAIDYVAAIGHDAILAHEDDILGYALERLRGLNDIQLVGTAPERASIISFLIDGVHPHDSGTILDQAGIAVRVGHHCAQPLMDHFDIAGTVRASFAVYNTRADVDALIDGLQDVRKVFA
ncbi:MAG: cysteine desulfurase [Proteobacteria bacterium]|nr:cysteine desulfurase [Pseudomonadota bacterium]MDA1059450.1 cysteine desulfurase [Pseudomonadota bacterium]